MTDNCFLCLEKAKKNMCPAGVCKMKCHYECYNEYISVKKISGNTIQCPVCRSERKIRYNLRRKKYEKYEIVGKDEFVYRVKNFLFLIKSSSGRGNKQELSIQMFEFMYCNLWFLEQNQIFANVVKMKLRELSNENNWDYPNELHYRFFGTYIM